MATPCAPLSAASRRSAMTRTTAAPRARDPLDDRVAACDDVHLRLVRSRVAYDLPGVDDETLQRRRTRVTWATSGRPHAPLSPCTAPPCARPRPGRGSTTVEPASGHVRGLDRRVAPRYARRAQRGAATATPRRRVGVGGTYLVGLQTHPRHAPAPTTCSSGSRGACEPVASSTKTRRRSPPGPGRGGRRRASPSRTCRTASQRPGERARHQGGPGPQSATAMASSEMQAGPSACRDGARRRWHPRRRGE